MTFNHEKFIATLLDTIISQKVNFRYEIIIADDASGDKTVEILNDYKNKYPETIKLFLNKTNKGVINNAKILDNNCKGKYTCFLDGDDYWTYDLKLQTQIDFLEKNHDYYGCFHDAKIISANPSGTGLLYKKQHFAGHETYSSINNYYTDFLPKHLINRNIIPTASLIFRKTELSGFLTDFADIKLSLNWAVHLYIIKNGKFKYFDKQWSVYNDHPDGVSKKYNYSEFIKTNIKVLKRFMTLKEFKKIRCEFYKSLSKEYMFLYHCTKHKHFPVAAILNNIKYRIIFIAVKTFRIQ